MLLRRVLVLPAALAGFTLLTPASPAQAADPVDLFIGGVSDTPDPAYAYDTVTYWVDLGNRGPGTASAVTLTAPLPEGVSFQPSASSDLCSATSTAVTCVLPSLDANAMASPLAVAVTPTAAGSLSLTFGVSAAEPEVDPSDNTQAETTTVTTPTDADVALDIGANVGPVYAGETFFVSVTTSNAGPAPATGVTTVLRLPAGLTTRSASCVPEGDGSVCTIGPTDLPPSRGESAVLEMTAAQPGNYEVSGSVTADQPDPDLTDNTGSVTFTAVAAADVAVTVTESADPAAPGLPLVYTIWVTNDGPSSASDVVLTEQWFTTVPGGLSVLSVDASQGQCTTTPSGVDCSLGGLAPGAVATVTVQVRPQGPGTVTDQAQVTATEYDPDPANNRASETTSVR